jgi:hypothetical protein
MKEKKKLDENEDVPWKENEIKRGKCCGRVFANQEGHFLNA